ncbi:MAG: hypothetical protein WDW38_010911 [Sanguina aurantia]
MVLRAEAVRSSPQNAQAAIHTSSATPLHNIDPAGNPQQQPSSEPAKGHPNAASPDSGAVPGSPTTCSQRRQQSAVPEERVGIVPSAVSLPEGDVQGVKEEGSGEDGVRESMEGVEVIDMTEDGEG